MTAAQEKLLKELSSNYQGVLKNFPEHAQDKVFEKLEAGYRIVSADSFVIEVNKGYAYYNIERDGRMYQI